MIYILQTSSAVCLCSLNSGCHDESTHNVPSHLGSHCLAMMSNATISGPILLFSTRVWMHRPLIVLFYKKLSHRLISIYTILYTYIVDDVLARICIYVLYYLQNSTQFILLLDPPTDRFRAMAREKETLLYEAKQSIAFPFFIQFRQGSFTRDTSHDGLHFSCCGI